ncbi:MULTISPECIES: ABC-three component system protein [Streptomyces griseus group]|uniref:ABC-three component system protein n=1 Tax=Streptomyces griseus group TaxID=629295 RepID=UPI00343B5892
MGKGSHGAAPNAIGYQHQTWWALVELLQSGADRPDAALSLELYDDVAWEEEGTPTELLQIKHHMGEHRTLTDSATDVWRTLKVWMDEASPADANGPALALVTTETAADDTAVAALRSSTRNDKEALRLLEQVARTSKSQLTQTARQQFLGLDSSERLTFVSRIRVIDQSPHIQDITSQVKRRLHWALPPGHEDLFLAGVWRWWDETALALLRGTQRRIDVGDAQAAIADIRDQFTRDNLPTLVELGDVNAGELEQKYRMHPFVQQMHWVAFPPRNLQKAIVDYYRAYTHSVRWLEEDLIGAAELTRFENELVDEWDREFEWMLDSLDEDAGDDEKKTAGKTLLRQLLGQTGLCVRSRFNDPFFARGQRHMLAELGKVGWHPDFETRIAELLKVNA